MSVTRARNIYGIEGRDYAHSTEATLNVWILSVILSLAAGIFPAWKASRLSPLEALRR